MNGVVIPHTPIAIDFWRPRAAPQAKLFFLSHMHTDHTSGLSSSWSHQIFCSEISARLLKSAFHLPSELITVLAVGCPTLVPVDFSGNHFVTVTALDANHCPGSLMFLFEGYFGVILYTADFRYDDQFMEQETLQRLQDIDVLYLDNTYCDPRCVFPTRESSAAEIIRLIQEHPDHQVFIGIHSLGKEWLLEQIAVQTRQWIVVGEIRFETLRSVQCLNVFSTDVDDSLLQVVKPHKLTVKNLEKWKSHYPTIAILPTALFVGQDKQPPNGVHVVPYSDHSSYPELVQFVSKIKPKLVIPIVKSKHATDELKSRTDMSCFRPFLSGNSGVEFDIPCSIIDFMNGSGLKGLPKQLISTHKPSRCQRKRSTASGVVFFDSPLKEENQESQQTVQTKSEEFQSTATDGPSASQDGGSVDDVDCKEVGVAEHATNVETVQEEGLTSDVLFGLLNPSCGVEDSQVGRGRCAADEEGVVEVIVEDEWREEREKVVCSAGGESVRVGVPVICDAEQHSPPTGARALPPWLNHSTPTVASEQSQAHHQTETKIVRAENTESLSDDSVIDIDLVAQTDSDSDKDGDDGGVWVVARKRPRLVSVIEELQQKRMDESRKIRHLGCQSDGQRAPTNGRVNRQSKLPLVRRPQVEHTAAAPHSAKPINNKPTGKTFYEQFYVGRNCDFAKRLLFSNEN